MDQNETRIILQRIGGILIVPMPDPLQEDFIKLLLTEALEYTYKNRIKGMILDLSGIEILDAHDLENIRLLTQSIMLMGASVVLAGIRPGVAAGLVMMDIDDSWVTSTLSVESAMELIR